jgi:hypothetical protein
MTIKLPLSVAILLLSLVGCAVVDTGDHTWFKEGATAHEQQAALAAAELQAVRADTTPALQKAIVLRSMTAQGWRLVPKNSAAPFQPNATRNPPVP